MSNGPACNFPVCPYGILHKAMTLLVLVIPSPQGPFLNSGKLFKHPRPSPVNLGPLSVCPEPGGADLGRPCGSAKSSQPFQPSVCILHLRLCPRGPSPGLEVGPLTLPGGAELRPLPWRPPQSCCWVDPCPLGDSSFLLHFLY